MASSFDNRNDILTRYNYERERRRRAQSVVPPQMMSAHEPVVNQSANVNPFQDNFAPSTNTMSMRQLASQVAPQPEQPFLERMARGAVSLPVGIAGLAEGMATDPAETAMGMGQSIAKHAAETAAIASDIPHPMNPLSGPRLLLKGASALGVPGIGGIEPQLQQLQEERKQAYITNPLLAPLDVAGLVGAGQATSMLSKIGRKSAVPKIIADAVAPEKPIVPEPTTNPQIPQAITEDLSQKSGATSPIRSNDLADVPEIGFGDIPDTKLYHGTNAKGLTADQFRVKNKSFNTETTGLLGEIETERHGIFLSESPEFAKSYGNNVIETRLKADANIVDVTEELKLDFLETLDAFKERDLWHTVKFASKKPWTLFEGDVGARFTKWLRDEGYDAARFPEDTFDSAGKNIESTTIVALDNSALQHPAQSPQPVGDKVTPSAKGEATELGAFGTPSALKGAMKLPEKAMIPIQYIAKKIDNFMEKRGIANPIGTPEIVLKNTGIVESFREAAGKEHAFVAEQSAKLKEILGGRVNNEKYLAEMFRHLDNPEAKLNKTEQALRGWFDDMLNQVNEFRVKRGEEPINYTQGYIPHIFDKAKQLLDDDQSIALPRKAQNRFANTRIGAEGYEKDLLQALELYTKSTARDMYVNDALHASIPTIEAMSNKGSKILRREVVTDAEGKAKTINFYNLNNADMWSKRGYAEAFVRAQLGLPTQGQRFFKQLGINPRTSQKVSNMATGLVYRNLLGVAIDTGIKNLSQITHTLAENGMAPTMRGIGKFLTPEGIKTARSEHLLKEFDAFLLAEDMPAATKAKIVKQFDENVINGAMRFSEFVNRGIAYHTALDDAIKAGKSIADAHEGALKSVRGTQYEYNKLGTSPFMRGPLTRPAAQFMTFPTKTSEMLFRWATEGDTGRGKLLRYFATVGGLVYAGKEVGVELGNIFFDPTKTVDKDSKSGFELPLSGNKVKIDPSRLGATGFAPQGAVPTVTKPYKYISDLIEKDRTAKERGVQAFRELMPGGRFLGKVYDVATGSEYKDERGRLIRKDSPSDAALKLLGGRSSNQETMRNKKSEIHDIENEYYETRRKIIDTQLNGDVEEAKEMIADFSKKYPYLASRLRKSLRQGRKDERKKKQMSSDERFMDNSIRQRIERNI